MSSNPNLSLQTLLLEQMAAKNISSDSAQGKAYLSQLGLLQTPSGGGVPINPDDGETTISSTVVKMTSLPVEDPKVVGQLWNNSGVLTVSAG